MTTNVTVIQNQSDRRCSLQNSGGELVHEALGILTDIGGDLNQAWEIPRRPPKPTTILFGLGSNDEYEFQLKLSSSFSGYSGKTHRQ